MIPFSQNSDIELSEEFCQTGTELLEEIDRVLSKSEIVQKRQSIVGIPITSFDQLVVLKGRLTVDLDRWRFAYEVQNSSQSILQQSFSSIDPIAIETTITDWYLNSIS